MVYIGRRATKKVMAIPNQNWESFEYNEAQQNELLRARTMSKGNKSNL
jgi:hypothetical protein